MLKLLLVLILLVIINITIISGKLYCTKDASLAVEPSLNDLFKIFMPASDELERLTDAINNATKPIIDSIKTNDNDDDNDNNDNTDNNNNNLINAILDVDGVKDYANKLVNEILDVNGVKRILDDDNLKLGQSILKESLVTIMPTGETRLAFLTYLSKGEFTIDLSDVSFHTVYLLQQNYHSMNAICSIAQYTSLKFGYNDYIINICNKKCVNGTVLSMAPEHKDLPEAALRNISADSWCYSKVCSSKDQRNNKCIIPIDPTRPACIWAPGQSNNTMNPVSYKLVTPMLSHQISFTDILHTTLIFIKKLFLNSLKLDKNTMNMIDNYCDNIGNTLDKISSYIPLYIAKLVIGSYIFYVAHDMTSSTFTRYLIAILIGFAFAMILIFYIVYQNGDNVRKKLPFVVQSLSGVVLMGYLWIYGIQQNLINSLLSYGIDYAWNFYDTGAFGIILLGKIFYTMSIFSSVWCTWYLGFFKPNSGSGKLIYWAVKIFGIIFLLDGTPNLDFSLILLVLVFFWNDINYFFYRLRMFIETSTQKPTWAFNVGGKLTREEYEQQTIDFTQLQLEKLRTTLQTNHSYREIVESSPYRDTRTLSNRFIAGNYWLPMPPPDNELEPKFSLIRFLFYVLIVASTLFAVVFISLHFAGYINIFGSEEL